MFLKKIRDYIVGDWVVHFDLGKKHVGFSQAATKKRALHLFEIFDNAVRVEKVSGLWKRTLSKNSKRSKKYVNLIPASRKKVIQ